MIVADLKAHEERCRVDLEQAIEAWQEFKRERVFSGKFDNAKEDALWNALTKARRAHDAAYDAAYGY